MAISFHASNTNTSHNPADAATLAITKPTVSAGDILVAVLGINYGLAIGTANFTAPTGWTVIGSQIATDKTSTQMWWADQSVASTTFTFHKGSASGTPDVSGVIISMSGCDTTTPVDAAGTGNSNTGANSISVATFNTVTDNALEVIGITDFNAGVYTSTGFTVKPSATTNCSTALLYANSAVSPAGATGAKTVNDSASASSNDLCYQQFALRPTSGGGGGSVFTSYYYLHLSGGGSM